MDKMKMLPNVTFDYESGTYNFTLWRDGKEVVHKLKGLIVYLEVIPDDDYEKTRNVKHYIYVKKYDSEEILISLSKDEYDVLEPMIEDIEDEIKDMARNSCPECGGSLTGSVYRPQCDSCTWDSNDTE